jgi:hypothetical protein
VQASKITEFQPTKPFLDRQRILTASELNGQLYQNRTLINSWQAGLKIKLLISNSL